MLTTPHTLIETQAELPSTTHVEGLAAAGAFQPTQEGTQDAFEQAVKALSIAYAARRGAPHVPVAPDVAEAVGLILPRLLDDLDRLPLYEACRHVERRILDRSPALRRELAEALALDTVRWRPVPGRQAHAFELASKVDVLMLAGGAGSGKTEVALGIGLYQSRVTRLMRRTSGEFTNALNRVAAIAGSLEGRNLGTSSWALPAPFGFGAKGCSLEWVGLSDGEQVLKLQGRPCDLLVADDAASGQLTRNDIEFASGWLRTVEPGLRTRLLLTANPATSSESLYLRDEWFAPWLSPSYAGAPAQDGEVRYFDGENNEVPAGTEGAQSRSLIRSTVLDNPMYLRTGYDKHLAKMPELMRRRMLHNDWSAGWDNDDLAQVIPGAVVDAAMARWSPTPPCDLDAIGVDVARGGKDRTAIIRRHGDWFAPLKVIPGHETPTGQHTAAAVLAERGSSRHAVVHIDATGVGASPTDILREKVPTNAVIFGGGIATLDASQSFGFVNVRSYLWWRFRELLQSRAIALPPDKQLKAELCAPRYELRGGRMYVESRDDLIRRLKRSADLATAIILASIDNSSAIAQQSHLLRQALKHAH